MSSLESTRHPFWKGTLVMNVITSARKFWKQLFGNRLRTADLASESYCLSLETLEERVLLSAYPSMYEQYMLELSNVARRDPAAYAASLGVDLNEGLATGTISSAAKQPLAFNPLLIDAARQHSQWMLDTNTFSHTGAGGSNPQQRMVAAGYVFNGSWTWGENIGVQGTTGPLNRVEFTRSIEEALFVDQNIPGRGHRLNLLNDQFAEVGVGVRSGQFNGYSSVMATQDFAKSDALAFLTGVVYDDSLLRDRFYTPGEGLGGITITAIRDGGGQTYSTTTWPSGGYSLELPKGRYSILVSGVGLGDSQFMPVVLMGTKNRKFDFRKGAVRTAPEVAVNGNGYAIIKGDSTPCAADGTDFGTVTLGELGAEGEFVILNIGNAPLDLTGMPQVILVGANPNDFSVSIQPPTEIAGGEAASFKVTFSPTATGLRTAIIQFANNDSNEDPFYFSISGVGSYSFRPAAFTSSGNASGDSGPAVNNPVAFGAPPMIVQVNPTIDSQDPSSFGEYNSSQTNALYPEIAKAPGTTSQSPIASLNGSSLQLSAYLRIGRKITSPSILALTGEA